MTKRLFISIISISLVFFAACGKKAPLKPPNVVLPNPPDKLTYELTEDGVLLLFRLPEKNDDGSDFNDFKEVYIYKARVVDEAAFCANCDNDYKLIYRGDTGKVKDGRVSFFDKDIDLKGLYYYKVRVANRDNSARNRGRGLSDFSAPVKVANKK